MRAEAGQAGPWLVRGIVAAATMLAATLAVATLLERPDPLSSAPVHAAVVESLDESLAEAASEPRPRFTVAFFGDSFVLPETLLTKDWATPTQLRRQLGQMMRSAGAGEPQDLRLVELTYSGLSLWSLYYLVDSIVQIRPEYLVIECNLFSFSDYWRVRDRKALSAMLPLERLPDALRLPLHETGLTMDEWLFGRSMLRLGAVPWWVAIQQEQARAAEWWSAFGDSAQSLVGAPALEYRRQAALLRIASTRQPARYRSTPEFSQLLLGKSLAGLDPDAPGLRMLAAALERLRRAGIPTLVYVPPYNLEHLRELGLLDGSRLDETIALVRSVVESSGARFHDAHALLGDAFFRDSMDHLHEKGAANGQRAVAIDLAGAMKGDWQGILAESR